MVPAHPKCAALKQEGPRTQRVFPWYVFALAFLIVGALFDDTLARVLRRTGSVLVLGACLTVLLGPNRAGKARPEWAQAGAL